MYPHNDPAGIVAQQYAPDAISGKQYYQPTGHGLEARYAERSERIRVTLGLSAAADDPPSAADDPPADAGQDATDAG